jgi:hypothetical protein
MTESQPSIGINWTTPFREAMTTSKMHHAVGMSQAIEVPPINQTLLAESINISFERSPLDQKTFEETTLKALDFATQNTIIYSGITAQDFYESNGENISNAQKSAEEFTDILSTIVSGNIQELNLPKPIVEFLSEIKNQPSSYDIRRGVERGILTAKQCEACEQVDPIIGAQFHIASAIMNRLYGDSAFTKFWNETYKGSVSEINNPQTVGLVDLIIVTVRDNKERFPVLDKFCGSNLKLGEGENAFEGTYYDMVDTPAYQNQ